MINRRYLDIVRLLLDHDDYITINDISKELKVSNKTIRNDLWQVDEWLKENGLSLLRKTGVGIKIEGKSEAKLDVYRSIKEKSDMNIAFSPEARKIYVGIKLIMEGTCRNFELANELYVSRATIHKDILGLIPIFKEHKIIVNRKNNNGVSVSGSEKNFRSLLSDFLYQSNGFAAFSKMVKNTDFECTGLFPFPPIDFNDDEMKEFLKVLEDANNEYIHNLLFTSLIQVLLHIFVSFIRISEGHYITLSPEFIKELDPQPFHKEAKEVTRLLSEHYHIEYPESETYYLQVFFISMQNSGINQNDEIDSAEAKRITMDLIDEWQRILGYPFDQDFKLIEAIYNHLCPAITRFKHGIQIENHLINDIEKLAAYSGGEQITEEDIDATLRGDLDRFAFGFLDALTSGKKDKAFRMFHNIIKTEDDFYRIYGLIVSQFELMLEAKELRDESADIDSIASMLKANPYRLKKAIVFAERAGTGKIKEILTYLYEVDRNIKTGNMKGDLALELMIGRI